jgi:putative endopeptidase
MMITLTRKPLVLALSLTLGACAAVAPNMTQTNPGIDVASMDSGTKACDNFFQYANGTWVKNNPIPADRVRWSAFDELIDRNLTALNQIALDAALNASTDHNTRLVGNLYLSAMDTAKIDASGAAPLQAELTRIAAINSPADVLEVVAGQHRAGLSLASISAWGRMQKTAPRRSPN